MKRLRDTTSCQDYGRVRSQTTEERREIDSQNARDEHAVPNMAPGTVSQIMAETSDGDTLNVSLCNAQGGL